ncbi:MAG TPA: glycoside hydrolase family 99-like domain-containing protein [Dongiaceae bacterium]|nr:glycoside hydrolase family 99-like domain-containing protein [Dongiaceae bacterium]
MEFDSHSIKLISMYLPQYHPIPENDQWWGKGFTEWTNVRKATPRFPGHYQPHVPGQLGYYDLRDPGTRAAQADLARSHGIHGFCYYHYWFNGQRLLETPFNEVLKSGEPDFPFCLCWANENWSRRWDGSEQEILIAQNYSDEDSLAFIESLVPAFRDSRYIRVNGKPLLLVYRTGLLPDPKRTADIWRDAMLKAGVGDLYLVRVENFMDGSEVLPSEIGFDAAVEFAPYWRAAGGTIESLAEVGGPPVSLKNMYVYDYDRGVEDMLVRQVPDYPFFRGVFPSWDNSARRKNEPSIVVNSSPEKFAFWLATVILQTLEKRQGDERMVFINAWNEWGEGCHLEPDERYGMAWLEAVRSAVACGRYYDSVLAINCQRRVDNDSREGWYTLFSEIFSSEAQNASPEELLAAIIPLVKTGQSGNGEKEIIRMLSKISARNEATLTAMTASLSWRLTAPIRGLLDRFRKLSD